MALGGVQGPQGNPVRVSAMGLASPSTYPELSPMGHLPCCSHLGSPTPQGPGQKHWVQRAREGGGEAWSMWL